MKTSKLHYVKVPEDHIVIDFDIPGPDGKKSYERMPSSVSLMQASTCIMLCNEDLAADALDNAMKDCSPNWERKLYEFLRTDQAERYLKR